MTAPMKPILILFAVLGILLLAVVAGRLPNPASRAKVIAAEAELDAIDRGIIHELAGRKGSR
jgi:hypothetical protein